MYPVAWRKDPDKWLDSNDIENVMKQYEEAFPYFDFMGPFPIDFAAPKPNMPPMSVMSLKPSLRSKLTNCNPPPHCPLGRVSAVGTNHNPVSPKTVPPPGFESCAHTLLAATTQKINPNAKWRMIFMTIV